MLVIQNSNAVIIGSIGTISYDLSELAEQGIVTKEMHLIRGAMGAALGCGLGYALAKPHEQVIVVVGDGSFLMQMGTYATIRKYALHNLRIIIIYNGTYASCGGQTNSFGVLPFEMFNRETYDVFTPTRETEPYTGGSGAPLIPSPY